MVADARARELARTEFERPLILEAGAGTGKTAALVSRIVAWSLEPGWLRCEEWLHKHSIGQPQPESPAADRIAARVLSRVVAITFTEAAAAQMADRVGQAFAKLAMGEPVQGLPRAAFTIGDEELVARARALRAGLDRLQVFTIHAYCRRLIASHALEAGLHPNFEIDAEGRLTTLVIREVLERELAQAYAAQPSGPLLAVAARGVGPGALASLLDQLVAAGAPADALAAELYTPERIAHSRQQLIRTLDRFFAANAGRLENTGARSSRTHQLLEALAGTRTRLEVWAVDHPRGLADAIELLGESFGESELNKLRDWSKGSFGALELACLEENEAELISACGELFARLRNWRDQDPDALELLRAALSPLLGEVHRELRRRGIQTYAGLLHDAHRLLSAAPELAGKIRRGIDQLLVDEFQDTDAQQCAILTAIALSGPREERPGLFLVGDPRQSIYGWRSADLRAYDDFAARVRAADGEVQALSVNFRSTPAILDEVKRVIEPVMVAERGVQPAFQALEAVHDDVDFTAAEVAPVEYWVPWQREPESGEARLASAGATAELEARALATDIAQVQRRSGTAYREFAVLFRSIGDLEIYLEAFKAAGIPYSVERDRRYYRCREVIDAAALVSCACDPHDHLALLTWLRSAAVGVPDAAWIPLWQQGFPGLMSGLHGQDATQLQRIFACVEAAKVATPTDVPGIDRVADWNQNLQAAVVSLAELREAALQDASDIFVEKLRTRTLLEVSEAARYLGHYRIANLERFFHELEENLEQTRGDLHEVVRMLRLDVAETREVEEARPKDTAEDAVRVMTIHAAKGLDFEHVYLMQLHKRPSNRRPDQLVVRHVDRFELRLFGVSSLGFDDYELERSTVEAAERVRTLYVAMTRAKRRLVLCGAWPLGKKPAADSYLPLLLKRAADAPELAAGMCELAQTGSSQFETAGARWVFPALRAFEVQPRQRAKRLALPDARAVRAASQALGQARRDASARMLRSFARTATERTSEEEFEATRGGSAIAAAVGSAVHRALEHFDFGADTQSELARASDTLTSSLRDSVAAAELAGACEEAQSYLRAFVESGLYRELRERATQIVAREFPVLLPPEDGEGGAVGYVSGVVDLVYRDGESGDYVVVDYKSGAVASESEAQTRAASFARQGAAYVRAVRDAFGLERAPRFELWFLREGLRVEPSLDA